MTGYRETYDTYSRRERGLTMVELMVALFLALILTGGLFYMMSGQQKTYQGQLHAMTSNENLWGAMEYLQSQVWKAGYGWSGCPPDALNKVYVPVVHKWNGSAGCTTNPCTVPDSQLTAMTVYNSEIRYTKEVIASSQGPDSFSVAYAVDNGDILTAVRTKIKAPEGTAVVTVSSDGSTTAHPTQTIKAKDRLVLWQHGSTKNCLAIVASGSPVSIGTVGKARYQIPFAPMGYKYNASNHGSMFETAGYAVQSLVLPLGQVTTRTVRFFSLDSNPEKDGAHIPKLMTWTEDAKGNRFDIQIIAEGIEDMQIAWGCDADGLGTLNEGVGTSNQQKDEWAFNVASDTVPNCTAVKNSVIEAVRITLIARTPTNIESKKGFRPGAEDRPAGTVAKDLQLNGGVGTYGRAVLTYTIKPRNIRKSVL